MTDPLVAAGGWCAPSDQVAALISEGGDLLIPEVQVSRGGATWPPPGRERAETPAIVLSDLRGHWEYGVDTADYDDGDTWPEIVSGISGYYEQFEPFRSAAEASAHHPGGKVYKRWVPAPGPWDEVAS